MKPCHQILIEMKLGEPRIGRKSYSEIYIYCHILKMRIIFPK